MAAELTSGRIGGGEGLAWRRFSRELGKRRPPRLLHFTARASGSMDDKNTVYKQLGMFSLKRKIEDAVLRAEMLAPTALELEEERWVKQEEMMRDYDLWDDPAKSNEILLKLADSERAVDALKDLKYKAEEAKLITQLAEMDAIDYGLFEQAYDSSLDVGTSLHHYEMSKLLRDRYDSEGACMIIKAGSEDANSQIWAERLVRMYTKWAEKLGRKARVFDDNFHFSSKGVNSASIEFEFEYAYGYLLGERGIHRLIKRSRIDSMSDEVCSASVDVVPLFLRTDPDLRVNDGDIVVSYSSKENLQRRHGQMTVRIQHLPTGIAVESSGERSWFANKMKALNRLKAKLLVIAKEHYLSDSDMEAKNARRYVCKPHKMVLDMKTGMEIPDLNSVLDGNIRPLVAAHIALRRSGDAF
ncbi:PREDICTED: peptide chain release factor PrfB3, chloroplastic [Tarenaya hassleriana]|uniref:peptide chain release factor PrfB3, chloroplastic n=1 Tax=Tarenaya hassleriana TaxID=28532 RepID=UPI00053C5C32|nr:PREDICTED: peptide chain release factor PrfB3, chloroplastic [Tarenaya hassleriana]XP_010525505.1 PREDICTED: peptide chain release factor PrfB3, chloroplastic [Tarenaya hassleriana]XP_010525506.1 PREDICTED: peptide chain release factor PrfB3, chloroplastic [Tarenaya hassleriana]XP_019056827.1 PREDICTED: peptide chain release factor PrfB3, chloroplastic [Tarenaya hassleriana]